MGVRHPAVTVNVSDVYEDDAIVTVRAEAEEQTV